MDPQDRMVDERRAGMWIGILVLVVMAASVISFFYAAAGGRWWLQPLASVQGIPIDEFFGAILFVTAIAFVAVHLFMGIALIRFPAHGTRRAAHWHEHLGAELTWTLVPAAAFIVLGVLGEFAWAHIYSAPPANAQQVEVVGRQFEWYIRYPGPGGTLGRWDPKFVTAENPLGLDPSDPAGKDNIVVINDLHLVVNRPVAVHIRAVDVIHSFFLPNFRVKQDALPGREVEIWFTPDRTGTYQIACAQLCGVGHYTMRGNVTVVASQKDFDTWLASQEKP
jgi:cytochrome c oxidase subunit II